MGEVPRIYQFVISAHGELVWKPRDYPIPRNTSIHTYRPGAVIECPNRLQTSVCMGLARGATHHYNGPVEYNSNRGVEWNDLNYLRANDRPFDIKLTGDESGNFLSGLVLCNPGERNEVIYDIDTEGSTTLRVLVDRAFRYVGRIHGNRDYNFHINITLLSCLYREGGGKVSLDPITGKATVVESAADTAAGGAGAGAGAGAAAAAPAPKPAAPKPKPASTPSAPPVPAAAPAPAPAPPAPAPAQFVHPYGHYYNNRIGAFNPALVAAAAAAAAAAPAATLASTENILMTGQRPQTAAGGVGAGAGAHPPGWAPAPAPAPAPAAGGAGAGAGMLSAAAPAAPAYVPRVPLTPINALITILRNDPQAVNRANIDDTLINLERSSTNENKSAYLRSLYEVYKRKLSGTANFYAKIRFALYISLIIVILRTLPEDALIHRIIEDYERLTDDLSPNVHAFHSDLRNVEQKLEYARYGVLPTFRTYEGGKRRRQTRRKTSRRTRSRKN